MRSNRVAVLTVACITGILGLAAPATASVSGTTIYVDPSTANCSDSGPGTQALPFCTITAAANSAQPDQTVQVAPVALREAVLITKPGLPGHPITIKGTDDFPSQPELDAPTGQSALTLSGVHDVVIDGLFTDGSSGTDPIVVKDSSQVVLDHMDVSDASQLPAPAAVLITGQSDHVTVSRSYLESTHGIEVDSQAQNTTIAGNDLYNSQAGAIRVSSAPGTVITNNTVNLGTGPGISLLGTSTGATVENNIVVGSATGASPAAGPDAQIAVSAGSATQTRVDYNIVHAPAGHPDYNWAGTGYTTVADFRANTQQGAHDVDSDIVFGKPAFFGDGLTDADTAAVKSADPNAPGIPATDLLGNGPTDDPKVPTPAGGNLLDRGAYQLQGLTWASLSAKGQYQSPQGPAPFTATFTAAVTNTWPTKLTYSYDFGDGTTQTSDQPATTHVYTTPSTYHPTVTVTDGVGGKVTSQPDQNVTVAAANATLQPSFTVKPSGNPLRYNLDASASAGPYRISSYAVDWNDGSAPSTEAFGFFQHTYAQPGTYNVTVTVTDESGAKATFSQQVTAAYDPAGYVAITPIRVLDTRWTAWGPAPLGPGETRGVNTLAVNGSTVVPAGATAVVVNLTATQGTDDSFLTAFPTGTKVPTASSVNFKARQDVSNVVTIPMSVDGSFDVYNHVGTTNVVVDVLGYYKPATGSNYTPATPTRLLDTRTTNTPLGQFGVRSLQVAGTSTVPANATAVALNVTATQGTEDSFLTVYPTGTTLPSTSNVNFKAGADTGNQVIVPVGQNGNIDIYNHIGNVHAIVDVFGYYSPDSKGKFIPVVPQRLMDTRQPSHHAVPADTDLPVGGVPTNATAAVLNVTAVNGTENSFLTVHAAGTPRPGTSNLNFGPGQTIPNEVITPVSNGSFEVYNHVGSTDVVTDLFGYFTTN